MAIVRWNPFRDMMDFRRDVDDLLGNIFNMTRIGGAEDQWSWTPRLNIEEDDDKFELTAEIPGINKDDIDVEVKGNVLTLKGEKKFEEEKKNKNFHLFERCYGNFTRTLRLPADVDTAKIDADYKDGVLRLVIPKLEEAKPKEIKVKVK